MERLNCPTCGYNLTGLRRDVCPECGQPFDRLSLAKKPWPVSRRQVLWRLVMAPSLWWLAIVAVEIPAWLTIAKQRASDHGHWLLAMVMAMAMGSISLSLWNAWMLGRKLGPTQAYRRQPDPALARTTLWTCLIGATALAAQWIVMTVGHLVLVMRF